MKDNKGTINIIASISIVCVMAVVLIVIVLGSKGKPEDDTGTGTSAVTPTEAPVSTPTAVPTEAPVATPTSTPIPTPTEVPVKVEYGEDGITVTEDGLERHYHYDDLEPEEIEDLIGYGVTEDELGKHGITPTPEPTPTPGLKAGDLMTDDENGLTGIVVPADDYKGIYTDDEGNRQVMVPEGFTSDDETVYYDEDGKPISTYFQAVSAQMADIMTYNDYDRWLAGNTRYQIEQLLIYYGYSKAEIEWALRDYDKTPEEETAMLVQWAMFAGIASKDTIEDYVKDRGGDPSLIDWSMVDDDSALKNFVHNLQLDIPNVTFEDVKEFARTVGGFTDLTGIEDYYSYDIYNANK